MSIVISHDKTSVCGRVNDRIVIEARYDVWKEWNICSISIEHDEVEAAVLVKCFGMVLEKVEELKKQM